MGEVAGRTADLAILTSDNPRGEDPVSILDEVRRGLRSSGRTDYVVEPDRRAAIRLAIDRADEDSIVLVAGKGHEQVQILGDRQVPFSDHDEIRIALEERFGPSQAG